MITARPRPLLTTGLIATSLSLAALLGTAADLNSVWAQETDSQVTQVQAPSTQTTPQAAAPGEITLTAIPPRYGDVETLKIKPGEKKQIQVRVRNSSNQTVTVESFAKDFVVGEDGSTPLPVTDEVSNRWSLASWLVLSPNSQVLRPNQLGMVNVLIQVPADALPGGHYAMITHTPNVGALTEGASESKVNQQVGTLLYVQVEGPINEEAFIRNLTMPKLSEFGPVPFSFTVENRSDIHITPRIAIEIYNLFGSKVDTITLESKNIFPLMNRGFDGEWNRVWGIGPYKAKVTMSYGSTGQVVMTKTSFWLIPYRLVLAISVVLLTLLAAILLTRRHWLHRKGADQERVKQLEERLKELEADRLKDLET
jgi:hypothetical protein